VKVVCPECGRTVGANPPKGGDGSGLRLRRHLKPPIKGGAEDCRGSRKDYWAGELEEVE
jgi:hypothetical protein